MYSLKGMVLIKGRRFLEEEQVSDTAGDDTSLEDDDSTIGISDVPQSSEERELVSREVYSWITFLLLLLLFLTLFVVISSLATCE